MKKIVVAVLVVGLLAVVGIISGVGPFNQKDASDNLASLEKEVTVFRSPNCGCCGNYVSYLERRGFLVKEVVTDDMATVKKQHGVPGSLESCHTSVVGDYVVEGHVPTEIIAKLLNEKPEIAGIALPGMPSGAPGMGGGKKEPFQVHTITRSGDDGGIFAEL